MNNRIQELLKAAGFYIYGKKIVAADNGSSGDASKCAKKLIQLVVQEIVSKMEVDGYDFYYNEVNEYGAVTVKFFVDCDPAKEMAGPEIQARFADGIRGTGRYSLNEKFVEYLIKLIDKEP